MKPQTRSRDNSVVNIAQAFIWILAFILPPMVSYLVTFDAGQSMKVLRGSLRFIAPLLVIYLLDLYMLAPKLIFKGKAAIAIIINLAIVVLLTAGNSLIMIDYMPPEIKATAMTFAIVTTFGAATVISATAIGISYIMRFNNMRQDLAEQRQKNSEAELSWLKSQLNPHFLFNTLNNISSMTQVDADAAQESIGQLSDLLRYAIYDSNQEFVPLSGEIDFMTNYVELMKLRCNELATVKTDFQRPSDDIQIAPLLFISLIENAFKHGVNARKESFVDISLHMDGTDLIFECANSYFPHTGTDHIGSGVGLENMKRRLELIYQGRYNYSQTIEDNTYKVKVTLRK